VFVVFEPANDQLFEADGLERYFGRGALCELGVDARGLRQAA